MSFSFSLSPCLRCHRNTTGRETALFLAERERVARARVVDVANVKLAGVLVHRREGALAALGLHVAVGVAAALPVQLRVAQLSDHGVAEERLHCDLLRLAAFEVARPDIGAPAPPTGPTGLLQSTTGRKVKNKKNVMKIFLLLRNHSS